MSLLFIPSSGRAHVQHTIAALPPWLHMRCRLVVPPAQLAMYCEAKKRSHGVPILAPPASVQGITATRKWIMEFACERKLRNFYMFDDDMRFARRTGDGVKLRPAKSAEMVDLFSTLEQWLRCAGVGCVGIPSRWDNGHCPDSYRYNARLINAYGYRTDVARKMEWGRVAFYEDHDMTMQLLRAGYATKVNYEFAYENAIAPQREGGCSDYRTPTNETLAVRAVYEYHKPFAVLKPGRVSKRFNGATIDAVHFKRKAAYLSGLSEELR